MALATAPDRTALRASRVHILMRLARAMSERLAELRASLADAPQLIDRLARLGHWLRLAVFLAVRISQGALDAPRPVPARRQPAAEREADEDLDAELRLDRECEFDRESEGSENFERYLDRPFGQVIRLICRGAGVTPDWDAWACEPWAQAEIQAAPWPPQDEAAPSLSRRGGRTDPSPPPRSPSTVIPERRERSDRRIRDPGVAAHVPRSFD